jgi:FMN phosphatase YigB (HAD superfamily)
MNLDVIEWLFFDMGGVILNDDQPERLRQATTLEVAKKYKPELTMEDVHTAWMNASGEQGSLRLLAFKNLLKDHPQLAEAEAEFNILCTHDYHGLSSIRPEAKDVLAKLSKHYKIGITANQSAKTGDILEIAGLLPYFSHQKMSAQIGLEKPDPKFFLHVLEETGAAPKKVSSLMTTGTED